MAKGIDRLEQLMRSVVDALKSTERRECPELWRASRDLLREIAGLAKAGKALAVSRGHAVWAEHLGPDGTTGMDGMVLVTFSKIERAREVSRWLNAEQRHGPLVRYQVLPDVSLAPPLHDPTDNEVRAWLEVDRRP